MSNEFYRLFLDPEMVYTCAYFRPTGTTISRRRRADKLDMICRKLRLKPGERLLDIGCGWGALICHAAQHYGVPATGVTLAEEQAELAREKVARLGPAGSGRVILQDFTQMEGEFDKISSIGMFEHVGIANYPTYFRDRPPAAEARAACTCITHRPPAKRDDEAFGEACREYTALTRYIFPGGELDHLGMSIANLERYGFEVHDVEAWREHYQRTCRAVVRPVPARMPEAEAEIGSVKTRLWLAYLAGCSLAFQRNTVGIFQTLASKRVKGRAELPPTRADLYEDWP